MACDFRRGVSESVFDSNANSADLPKAEAPYCNMAGQGVAVHSLHLYPIKSCRPVDVRAAHVTPTGEEIVSCSMTYRAVSCSLCAPVRNFSGQDGAC
jgi:MOSC N-terminal beta barrel domain